MIQMNGYPWNNQQTYYPNQYSQPMQQQNYVAPQSIPQTQNSSNQATEGILGKVITDPTQIMPNEVPMNGEYAIFPTADYSCVYAKAWNNDGTIRTIKFVPEKEETIKTEEKEAFSTTLIDKLDSIEKTLSKMIKTEDKKTK